MATDKNLLQNSTAEQSHPKDDKQSDALDKELEERKLKLEEDKLAKSDALEQKKYLLEDKKADKSAELEQKKYLLEDKKADKSAELEQNKYLLEEKKYLLEEKKVDKSDGLERYKVDTSASLEREKYRITLAKYAIVAIGLLLFFIAFSDPINKAVIALLGRTPQKITIGSFSLELEKQAKFVSGGDDTLATLLKDLSPADLTDLIQIPREARMMLASVSEREGKVQYTVPSNERFATLIRLEEKGLISAVEPLTKYKDFLDGLGLENPIMSENGRQTFIQQSHLSAEDEARLMNMWYTRTERGTQAVQAIALTILNLLEESQ